MSDFIYLSTQIIILKINIEIIHMMKFNCATSIGSSEVFASSIIASFDVNAVICLGVVKRKLALKKLSFNPGES